MTLGYCGKGQLSSNYYFNYDQANRLNYFGTTSQSTTPNSYCYDNVGNITYNNYGNPTVNSINQAGELTNSYNPGSGNNPCGSLTYGTTNTNYTYNSLGDRTQLNDGSYLFNYGYNTIGELTSYSFLSTNNFYYSYNHLLLAGINSNTGATQQLTYDNGNSNILFDSTYDYIYGPTNIPIEQVNVTEPYSAASSGSSGATDNPNYMYYSPTATMTGYMIANTIGNLDNAYYYGPYGNLNSGTVGSSFGYAGQYIGDQNQYSTTTNPLYSGLVYMKNRYYDPATGVFVSQDPLINQTNQAYVYAGDNPVSNWDPSGECVVRARNGEVIMRDNLVCQNNMNYWDTSCTGKYSSYCSQNGQSAKWIDPYKGTDSMWIVLGCLGFGNYNVNSDSSCLKDNGQGNINSTCAQQRIGLAYQFFRQNTIFTASQISAILGNILQEDGGVNALNPGIGNYSTGYGIIQWTSYTSNELSRYASHYGISAGSLVSQLGATYWLINGSSPYGEWEADSYAVSQFRNSYGDTPGELATYIDEGIEEGYIGTQTVTAENNQRQCYATEIYNQFNSNKFPVTGCNVNLP